MKHRIEMNYDFLTFVYIGLQRIKRNQTITLWDYIQALEMTAKKVDLMNRKSKGEKIVFKRVPSEKAKTTA